MKRRAIGLLKLALVAALMLFVLSQLKLDDSWSVQRGTEPEQVTTGRIEGEWDAAEVRFVLPDGTRRTVRPGTADGARVAVNPGFLTLVRNLDWGLFVLGALAYFASMTIAASRWWWLLRINSLPIGFLRAQRLTWVGAFFNNVVPGATGGDLVKALYVMKDSPGARAAALVSVVVDRVIGLASLAVLGGVAVLLALDRFRELALALWIVLAGIAVLGVVAFSRRIRRLVRLDWLLNRLPARIGAPLRRIDQAVFFYRGHKLGLALWFAGGILNHVVSVLSVLWMGIGLGLTLRAFDYFVLVPIINTVTAIPIAPNGWGWGEFLYGRLFSEQGVSFTAGVALSLLYRLHLTAWSLLGGVLVLFERERVTAADIEAEVERERAEEAAAGADVQPHPAVASLPAGPDRAETR
jgi:uncharacterized protein (TIRG00374 family)